MRLTWKSRLLATHPQVLERLRSEVKEHAGIGPNAEPPSRETLKKMSYLGFVIKEGEPDDLQLGELLR